MPGLSGPPATASESARSLLEASVQNQLFLKATMQGALDASIMRAPPVLTGPPVGTTTQGPP